MILQNPIIYFSNRMIYESQSNIVFIVGHGFTNVAETKLTLSPTSTDAYKVMYVSEDAIRLALQPNTDWLPHLSALQQTQHIPLNVTSLDTGAGDVKFDIPVTVGFIVKDLDILPIYATCSNICQYAFDGVCDDTRGSNFCKVGTDCHDCGPLCYKRIYLILDCWLVHF